MHERCHGRMTKEGFATIDYDCRKGPLDYAETALEVSADAAGERLRNLEAVRA
jgi:hypothetical protein